MEEKGRRWLKVSAFDAPMGSLGIYIPLSMFLFMDYLLLALVTLGLIWTALWGILPPVVVGWYAYKQGKRGREEALKMRDDAYARIDAVVADLKAHTDIAAALYRVDPATNHSPLEDIRDAICATMDGKMGRYIRDIKESGADFGVKDLIGMFSQGGKRK